MLNKCERCKTFFSRFKFKAHATYTELMILNSNVARSYSNELLCMSCFNKVNKAMSEEIEAVYEKRLSELL